MPIDLMSMAEGAPKTVPGSPRAFSNGQSPPTSRDGSFKADMPKQNGAIKDWYGVNASSSREGTLEKNVPVRVQADLQDTTVADPKPLAKSESEQPTAEPRPIDTTTWSTADDEVASASEAAEPNVTLDAEAAVAKATASVHAVTAKAEAREVEAPKEWASTGVTETYTGATETDTPTPAEAPQGSEPATPRPAKEPMEEQDPTEYEKVKALLDDPYPVSSRLFNARARANSTGNPRILHPTSPVPAPSGRASASANRDAGINLGGLGIGGSGGSSGTCSTSGTSGTSGTSLPKLSLDLFAGMDFLCFKDRRKPKSGHMRSMSSPPPQRM